MSSTFKKNPGVYKLLFSCHHYVLCKNVICLRVSSHQNKHHSTLFDDVHLSYKLQVHFVLRSKWSRRIITSVISKSSFQPLPWSNLCGSHYAVIPWSSKISHPSHHNIMNSRTDVLDLCPCMHLTMHAFRQICCMAHGTMTRNLKWI